MVFIIEVVTFLAYMQGLARDHPICFGSVRGKVIELIAREYHRGH